MKTILLKVEYKDHDKVVLTNPNGDTYTSKSEDLMDFLHGAKENTLPIADIAGKAWDSGWQYGHADGAGIMEFTNPSVPSLQQRGFIGLILWGNQWGHLRYLKAKRKLWKLGIFILRCKYKKSNEINRCSFFVPKHKNKKH